MVVKWTGEGSQDSAQHVLSLNISSIGLSCPLRVERLFLGIDICTDNSGRDVPTPQKLRLRRKVTDIFKGEISVLARPLTVHYRPQDFQRFCEHK